MSRNILIEIALLLALISYVSAFFWGSSEQSTPPTTYFYSKRLLQGPVYVSEADRRRIPAVPVQMPLQAQLSPISNLHNVQLVPCLCPVTADGSSYDTQQPQENFYMGPNGNIVQHQQQGYPQPNSQK